MANNENNKSKLIGDSDFPRGGARTSTLTSLEWRDAVEKANKESTEQELFSAEANTTSSDKNKKRKQHQDAKAAKKAKRDAEFAVDTTSRPPKEKGDQGLQSVSAFTHKKLVAGVEVLCVIKEIHELGLSVSLPNQMSANVSIAEISNELTAIIQKATATENDNDDSDDEMEESDNELPSLSSLFSVGQAFPCVVLEADENAKKAKTQLSLRPDRLNADFDSTELIPGLTLSASVKSQEDNGYILSLGFKNNEFHAFLHNKHATALARSIHKDVDPKLARLSVGQVVYCAILTVDQIKKMITVTADPADIAAAIIPNSHTLSFPSLKPGMLISARVKSAINNNGVIVSFMGLFDGTIELSHLGPKVNNSQASVDDLESLFPQKSKLQARILYVDDSRKRVGLTLLKHIVEWCTVATAAKLFESVVFGHIFEEASVKRVDGELGLYLNLDDNTESTGIRGYAHVTRLSDREHNKVSIAKYAPETVHRVRAVGHDLLDNIVQVSLKASVLDATFMNHKDIQAGDIVKAKIKKVEEFGLIVSLTDRINGVIPSSHLGEAVVKNPSRIFKVDATVKCRVLAVDVEAKKVVLTLKKPLVNSTLHIVSTYDASNIDTITEGHILAIKDFGLIVGFYNNVKAIVPKKELSSHYVADANTIFSVGQVVRCKILSTDADASKMSASIKQATETAAAGVVANGIVGGSASAIQVGVLYSAKVLALTANAAIVEMQPSGARAILPKSHLSDHASHIDELFSGLAVDFVLKSVVVVERDVEKDRVLVSMKQALVAQGKKSEGGESAAVKTGSIIAGYIKNVTESTCFVGYVGGFTGVVNLKTISDEFVGKLSDFVQPGQTVVTKIMKAGKTANHFFVSMQKTEIIPALRAQGPTDLFYTTSLFAEQDKLCQINKTEVEDANLWCEKFGIGKTHQVVVKQKSATGYIVSAEDTASALLHVQLGKLVEIGSEIEARVVDVNFRKRAVDFALVETITDGKDITDRPQISSCISKKNTVSAVVQVFKNDYIVVSLPSLGNRIAFAPVRGFYTSGVPKKATGQTLQVVVLKDMTAVSLKKSNKSFDGVSNQRIYVAVTSSNQQNSKKDKSKKTATIEKSENGLDDASAKKDEKKKKPTADQETEEKTAAIEGEDGSGTSKKNSMKKQTEKNEKSSNGVKKLTINDLSVGMFVTGHVDGFEENGIFIKLDNSKLSGLCHKSELSDKPVVKMDSVVSVGDKVKAVILKLNKEKKRISFGLKPSYFAKDIDIDVMDVDGEKKCENAHLNERRNSTENEPEIPQKKRNPAKTTQPKIVKEIAPLDLGGAGWGDDSDDSDHSKNGEPSDSEDGDGNNDSDDEERTNNESKKSKRAKKRAKQEAEERVAQQELELLEIKAPDSADSFERILMGSPNSSFLWIKFMAFHLQMAEIGKAREVGERALKVISFREPQELINVWVALLNLENAYGDRDSLTRLFERSVAANEPKAMYLNLANIYERSNNFDELDPLFATMTKRFKESCKIWVANGLSLLKRGQVAESRQILQRSLKSLAKRKHLKIICKFAQMEFKHGEAERGRTLFEGIVSNHPKRLDMWSIYLDMEIRNGDVDHTRRLFERVLALKQSSRKMKFVFKKYLEFEKTKGTPEGVQHVKESAMEYVARISEN
ncbi:rRNA biogenesis protein rrp5 [Physocladia obscura]|uniref:rRNA biogenesis protein rrp5 n=1 Tax=Physocladia obscura TaxID=109957 RepID=A0AAD5XHY9_9FUNG|nr:rRNA biogenesis protein rrp5 [Physocladia obscura]